MKGYFIYFFYDHSDKLLYIGKTTNITERMKQHLSTKSIEENTWKDSINRKNIILYECLSPTDLEIYETYFINKYHPIQNRSKYYKHPPSFDLPYLKPINPFISQIEATNILLGLWQKLERAEKYAVLALTNIEGCYLSLDKEKNLYLDESKYGQIYTYVRPPTRYQQE